MVMMKKGWSRAGVLLTVSGHGSPWLPHNRRRDRGLREGERGRRSAEPLDWTHRCKLFPDRQRAWTETNTGRGFTYSIIVSFRPTYKNWDFFVTVVTLIK